MKTLMTLLIGVVAICTAVGISVLLVLGHPKAMLAILVVGLVIIFALDLIISVKSEKNGD